MNGKQIKEGVIIKRLLFISLIFISQKSTAQLEVNLYFREGFFAKKEQILAIMYICDSTVLQENSNNTWKLNSELCNNLNNYIINLRTNKALYIFQLNSECLHKGMTIELEKISNMYYCYYQCPDLGHAIGISSHIQIQRFKWSKPKYKIH